jgi:glycosyltransferase involved in cell wall biosynthesis
MLCQAKGAFDLLNAWVKFRDRVPGWRLVIGGHGEVERFLSEAERLGIRAEVDYLGWLSGSDKERELSAADIFVLPSYNEGMPVSILEAMAYGAAVIATPVGGVPDMMQQDVHGLWIEPGDVLGLASCLERLANAPELRAKLRKSSGSHVRSHYSVETVIKRIRALYGELAPG